MEEVDSLNKSQGDTKPQSKLIDSDAPTPMGNAGDVITAQKQESKFYVNGKEVSRDEYVKALPDASYDPARMPANHYPAINTK